MTSVAQLQTRVEGTWRGAFAPASVSNVGPGFDCFGFAIDAPGDSVYVRLVSEPGVRIESITGDHGELSHEIGLNTAGTAALAIWSRYPEINKTRGLEVRIIKQMRIGSGLGSSAASAVAASVAVMRTVSEEIGAPYDEPAVLAAALDGETVASGARHADNVAPALMGGFTVVQSVDPPIVTRFEPQLKFRVVVVLPDMTITTRQAREILPKQVPLRDAVANWTNAASLVLALTTGNEKLLRVALHDHVVEPYRAKLIPGFDNVRRAAIDSGAYGCSISGSGPAVFALCPTQRTAVSTAEAVCEAFARQNLKCERYVTSIANHGARHI